MTPPAGVEAALAPAARGSRGRVAGGVALVAVGAVFLLLPGPGLPLIALGLRRLGWLGGAPA